MSGGHPADVTDEEAMRRLDAAGIAYTYGVDPWADTDLPQIRVALDDLQRANTLLNARHCDEEPEDRDG